MTCDGPTSLSASDVVRIARTLGLDPILFVEAVPGDGPLIDGRPSRIVMRRRDSECVFTLRLHSGARVCGLGELGPCMRARAGAEEGAEAWNALVRARPMPLEVYLDHLLSEHGE